MLLILVQTTEHRTEKAVFFTFFGVFLLLLLYLIYECHTDVIVKPNPLIYFGYFEWNEQKCISLDCSELLLKLK